MYRREVIPETGARTDIIKHHTIFDRLRSFDQHMEKRLKGILKDLMNSRCHRGDRFIEIARERINIALSEDVKDGHISDYHITVAEDSIHIVYNEVGKVKLTEIRITY